jgi:hypothetical protein
MRSVIHAVEVSIYECNLIPIRKLVLSKSGMDFDLSVGLGPINASLRVKGLPPCLVTDRKLEMAVNHLADFQRHLFEGGELTLHCVGLEMLWRRHDRSCWARGEIDREWGMIIRWVDIGSLLLLRAMMVEGFVENDSMSDIVQTCLHGSSTTNIPLQDCP